MTKNPIDLSLADKSKSECRKPAAGNHAKLPAIMEFTYDRARKALLSNGWQPLQTRTAIELKSEHRIDYGNGKMFWEKGYVELENCAGTGVSPCSFQFRDAYGNRLRVTTAGEESPKVTGFQFTCE